MPGRERSASSRTGARRAGGATAGWWAAGLLIAGATALQPTDAQAANFAHLALLPACGALVAARIGSRRSAILAGILVGVATLTRQTWIIGVVPAAYAAWWSSGRRAERIVFVAAGAAATIMAVALVAPFGAFWHWAFAGDGSVLALGESQNVGERGGLALELFVLANVASLWLLLRRGRRREDLDLWLWLATALRRVRRRLAVLRPLLAAGAPAVVRARRARCRRVPTGDSPHARGGRRGSRDRGMGPRAEPHPPRSDRSRRWPRTPPHTRMRAIA